MLELPLKSLRLRWAFALLPMVACAHTRGSEPTPPEDLAGGPEPLASPLANMPLAGWEARQLHPPVVRETPTALSQEEPPYLRALREQVASRLDAILGPAGVPPPGIRHQVLEQTLGGVTLRVWPLRPEDQPWNQWTDGLFRLFNNARGYLWGVEVETPVQVRWLPARSRLAVNQEDNLFEAVRRPEDCIREILFLANWGEAGELGLDLRGRLLAADPFLDGYLPVDVPAGVSQHVVLFSAPVMSLDPVVMRLQMAFNIPGQGMQTFDILFE